MMRMLTTMPKKPSAIARELKQTRPFDAPGDEALVTLLRTADVLRGELERALGKHGITVQQFNVLRILRGSHPKPLPTLEIADRMIERAPGITRLIDRLENAGLVARKRCPEDRRIVHCAITAAGLEVLAQSMPTARTIGRKRSSRLTEEELDRLTELLDRLREEVT